MTDITERRKGDRGRPRSGIGPRPDLSPRDQILDAAAHQFVERGYAATSTRAIADEVGIRQASLYYHFPSKESILEVLLMRTVEPSILVADLIAVSPTSAAARLYALVCFDANQLFAGAYNVGALYFLPEVRLARFDGFRTERARLRSTYGSLVGQSVTPDLARDFGSTNRTAAPDDLVDVVFGMVESAISIRADRPDADRGILVTTIAHGCLRVLGHDAEAITAIAATARHLLDEVRVPLSSA